MISDAIALYDLITKKYKDFKTISAMFDWSGKRIEGNEQIEVEFNPVRYQGKKTDNFWFYCINPIEDYVFIRIPVNIGCVVESAFHSIDETNPDSNKFRYVQTPDGFIYNTGYIPNVKTDFIVVGYKPKDLLKLAEDKL